MRRVLAISAHPDDETLGAGGTLVRLREQKAELHWLVLTKAYAPAWSEDVIARKEKEVQAVAEAYGTESLTWTGLRSTHLDPTPGEEEIAAVRETIARTKPDTVFVVGPADVHSDHLAAYRATVAVCKAFRTGETGVRTLLTYECSSSTDAAPPAGWPAFRPTVFVDVTATIDRKLEIMSLYETETQDDPLPRGSSAIRALARVRGSAVGVDYAEAFSLARHVVL